jgi:hypothetical protein
MSIKLFVMHFVTTVFENLVSLVFKFSYSKGYPGYTVVAGCGGSEGAGGGSGFRHRDLRRVSRRGLCDPIS